MKQIFWSLLLFLFLTDILYKKFIENPTVPTQADTTDADEGTRLNTHEASSFQVKEVKTIEKNNEATDYNLEGIDATGNDRLILIVKYCPTHVKNFDELKKELMGNYTNIELKGEEYPLPLPKKILSKVLFGFQMSMMAFLIGGKWIKNYLTFIPENVFKFIEEKRFMLSIANFFVIGQLSNMFNSSGAFEVIYNGSNIWSKLELKMIPTAKEIVTILSDKGVELI